MLCYVMLLYFIILYYIIILYYMCIKCNLTILLYILNVLIMYFYHFNLTYFKVLTIPNYVQLFCKLIKVSVYWKVGVFYAFRYYYIGIPYILFL